MNKIIIRDIQSIEIKEDSYISFDLCKKEGNIVIDIYPNVTVKIFELSKDSSINYEYIVKQNSKVDISRMLINSSNELSINMLGEDSTIKCATSVISNSTSSYIQNINHNANNTQSEIYNNMINISRDCTIKVNAKVDDKIINCITRQDNKIINLGDGNNKIVPNLLINNDSVNASHSAYIGKFNKEHIFYLQSRGIALKDIYELLITGILIGNMELNNEDKSYVINEIKTYLQEVNYES